MNVTPNTRVLCDCGTEVIPARTAYPRTVRLQGVCRDCIREFGPPVRQRSEAPPRPFLEPAKAKVIHRLLTAICEVYGNGKCIHSELMEADRFEEYVEPRQVGHYLSVTSLGISSRDCGNFWNKDHSTISYSAARISVKLGTDAPLAAKLLAVQEHYTWLAEHRDKPISVHHYSADHTAVGVARFR